jgi:hypothetical protein
MLNLTIYVIMGSESERMNKLEKKDVLRLARTKKVRFVQLWVTDILARVTYSELN